MLAVKNLSESQSGMLDYLITQSRCLNRGVRVGAVAAYPAGDELEPAAGKDWLVASARLYGVERNLLLVAEDNIKARLVRSESNAVWRMIRDPLNYPGRFGVARVDAVAIFYEPSWRPGAVWEESEGNCYKDDYRRLAYVGDVTRYWALEDCWDEIPTRFSEKNLLNLLTGERLVDEVSR